MSDPPAKPEHPCIADEFARLKAIIGKHTPHANSLLFVESRESYNENAAREDFGSEFINALKKAHIRFRGDWWQLAVLIRHCELDELNRLCPAEHLLLWNQWRKEILANEGSEMLHLEHAFLRETHLEHAILIDAHLEHADLMFAHLEHAILRKAHLEHATLISAHLEHANLGLAYLDRAGVWFARGLLLDDNRIEGIHIEGDARDPWSVLRRTYTGPWFFVHLLLLTIFFAPYVGRAIYYTAMGHMQEWSTGQYDKLGEHLGEIERFRHLHREARERFVQTHDHRRAIWVLLGWDHTSWPMILATVVILYNVLRGYLTMQVSMLRDAEERSQTTPRLVDYYGLFHPISHWKWHRLKDWRGAYLHAGRRPFPRIWSVLKFMCNDWIGLYRAHVFARVLFWFAIASVTINTYLWTHKTWIWVPIAN